MSDQTERDRFSWHPRWSGQTGDEVLAALRDEIESDQRSYQLALAGAEIHENNALASVVALDRKWGGFSMDWAEIDAGELAAAMLALEWQREERREMLTPAALGLTATLTPPAVEPDDFPEKSLRLTDPTGRLVALVVVLAIFGLFAFWVLR